MSNSKLKLYQTKPFIVLSLFFLFPLGVFLLFKYTKVHNVIKVLVAVVCGLFTIPIAVVLTQTNDVPLVSIDSKSQVQKNKETPEEIAKYEASMLDILIRETDYITTMGELNNLVLKNPLLMMTDEYKNALTVGKNTALTINTQMKELTPPEKYKEVHSHMLKASEYHVKWSSCLEEGIKNSDSNKIIEAGEFGEKAKSENDIIRDLLSKLGK